ncbi:MAG: UDP-N-acetylglucosamine 1-carboxyvinyltransferase, partial [Spirochaetaceae bacterium]|nr:UDP-N-acetylglucosamine 1-carboxyvinyltransferase [Spirochaetaceae bacterium]
MLNNYIVQGGNPISGVIQASGNKNAALPCIAAALLTSEDVTLRNIPDIEDTRVMLDIFRALGGTAETNGGSLHLKAASIAGVAIPEAAAEKIRASILFAGPLLA